MAIENEYTWNCLQGTAPVPQSAQGMDPKNASESKEASDQTDYISLFSMSYSLNTFGKYGSFCFLNDYQAFINYERGFIVMITGC